MAGRIGYIDAIKGLAIVLVVMGHVVVNQFPNFDEVMGSEPVTASLVWRIIYSFHMPLFMFCSGLFALRIKEYTMKNIGQSIWKRALTLLLPFFVVGALKYIILGGVFLAYWYLWVLFWFLVITTAVDCICSLIPKHGQTISTIIIILLSLIDYLFGGKLQRFEYMPFVDISHMHLYLYFAMGVICARYDLCERWFSKNWVFTYAIIVFGFLTYWITYADAIPSGVVRSLCNRVIPISAIITCVYLFSKGLDGTSWVEGRLRDIGQHSLEIYLLHEFCLFRIYAVGECVLKYANLTGGGRTAVMVQLLSTLIETSIIIVLCYILLTILTKSKVLSMAILGRKHKQ